jgi:hypothetical protein
MNTEYGESHLYSERLSLSADGTITSDGWDWGKRTRAESQWSLVQDATDHVTIDVGTSLGERERMTFVFERPELLRRDRADSEPCWYRRVKWPRALVRVL